MSEVQEFTWIFAGIEDGLRQRSLSMMASGYLWDCPKFYSSFSYLKSHFKVILKYKTMKDPGILKQSSSQVGHTEVAPISSREQRWEGGRTLPTSTVQILYKIETISEPRSFFHGWNFVGNPKFFMV